MVHAAHFKLADLPPLPSDTVSWSATNFDAALFHDAVLEATDSIVALASPESLPLLKGFLQQPAE